MINDKYDEMLSRLKTHHENEKELTDELHMEKNMEMHEMFQYFDKEMHSFQNKFKEFNHEKALSF